MAQKQRMGKTVSRAGRIKPLLQILLRDYIEKGYNPTTEELIQGVYGKEYKPDSRVQRDSVYQAIIRIRDDVIEAWENYCTTKEFELDLTHIEFYEQDKVEATFATEEFGEFYLELNKGRFGEKTKEIKPYLKEFGHIAVAWDKKITDLTKTGNPLVIAEYGKQSKWYKPSFWKWGIRETELYLRSFNCIRKQLTRGTNTKIALNENSNIKKALGYLDSSLAALTDGVTWTCKCKMLNTGSSNYCSNCGKPKTTEN